MAVTARKYNPGFLTDDELVASFCVRTAEFETIVEVLRECTGTSNPHQIVIGPRGSGKTSLLLRIAAEVRRDSTLAASFFPVVFAEESYEVSTPGEFWLECLARLEAQAPRHEDESDLRRTFEELRTIRDDRELADRCLGALLDFSDREGKRLVLMVENLDMMFRDMADPDAGWRLRKVLQTEPRVVLLASATSRFNEIDDPEHALYDLFSVRTLRPLDTSECATLWDAVAGQCPPPGTIRSLEILTGGSPRLITIVACFGAELSFRKLMASLLDLIDDHTEYFKSHLEALPAQERRVYLALAALWKPATTKEIADHARLDTSKCSAQLTRLVERGAVQTAGGTARRKQYYLTERLYNIYYLLRRSRRSDRLVEALIHFMEAYYSPSELKDIGARIIHEAKSFTAEMQSLSQAALTRLMELPVLAEHREELLAMTPKGFVEVTGRDSLFTDTARVTGVAAKPEDHGSDQLQERTDEDEEQAARKLFKIASTLDSRNREEDALNSYGEVVRRFGKSEAPGVLVWIRLSLLHKGLVLQRLGRADEAIAACDELARRFGENETAVSRESVVQALVMKGLVLQGQGRTADALAAYDEVKRRFGESGIPSVAQGVAKALVMKSLVLRRLNRWEDALAACEELICHVGENEDSTFDEQIVHAFVSKGEILSGLSRPHEALATFEEVIRRFGEDTSPTVLAEIAYAFVSKGDLLAGMSRPHEALTAYEEVVRRFGDVKAHTADASVARALVRRGTLLIEISQPDEALDLFTEVVRRFGKNKQPNVAQQITEAVVNKRVLLGAMNRPHDTLEACDEVLRRFKEDESPFMAHQVEVSLVTKGHVLQRLNRSDEALAAYDEILRRFDEDKTPVLSDATIIAILHEKATLTRLNQPLDSLGAYDGSIRQFQEGKFPILQWTVEEALLSRAAIELKCRKQEAAAETAGRVLVLPQPGSPENRLRAHTIRARAGLADGDRTACERDVEAAFVVLPAIPYMPPVCFSDLMVLSLRLGAERMCELIKGSPAADLLLPFTTALELELGLEPRVAQEVREVAEDIRGELVEMRETATDGSGKEEVVSGTDVDTEQKGA